MKKNPISRYFQEASEELHAVTWPTKQQMVKLTIIVLGFTLLFSGFVALTDYLFNQGNDALLDLIR